MRRSRIRLPSSKASPAVDLGCVPWTGSGIILPVKDAVADGKLREDLFLRLNASSIALPPLRDRGDDIALLAEHFVDELNRENHVSGITSGAPKRVSPDFRMPGCLQIS